MFTHRCLILEFNDCRRVADPAVIPTTLHVFTECSDKALFYEEIINHPPKSIILRQGETLKPCSGRNSTPTKGKSKIPIDVNGIGIYSQLAGYSYLYLNESN